MFKTLNIRWPSYWKPSHEEADLLKAERYSNSQTILSLKIGNAHVVKAILSKDQIAELRDFLNEILTGPDDS